ncbi:MAG: glycosyltransferase [Coriobacteriia bacterium]|nr:glycosyltransferase [Coriobacteriia bacterium]
MKLNVLLITYNASDYIEECLSSIMMQKADFTFNVIVADDFSTDDTLAKIEQMSQGSKLEFVYLSAPGNLGIGRNYQRAFKACSAEYIAVMEGDDYWSDPLRLQKHVDFLESHHECAMSQNNRINANFDSLDFVNPFTINRMPQLFEEAKREGFLRLGVREMRGKSYGLFGSNFSSCVYRRQLTDKLPLPYFEDPGFHEVGINTLICMKGMLGFLPEAMTVHIVHEDSLWNRNSNSEKLHANLRNIEAVRGYAKGGLAEDLDTLILWYQKHIEKERAASQQQTTEGEPLTEVEPGADAEAGAVTKSEAEPGADAGTEPGAATDELPAEQPRATRTLKLVWKCLPPFITWIIKALVPKIITEKFIDS